MVRQPHPPSEDASPPAADLGGAFAGFGAASLAFAVFAPFSLILTAVVNLVLMVAASILGAPLYLHKLPPLLFLSAPVFCGLLSVWLAIAALRGRPGGWKNRWPAVAALCVNGVVFSFGFAALQRQ